MFLSLIHMFGFWCQILVQLAYDFGAKFQTYLSEKEICVATSYYKMKKDIKQQLQYTIQLKPRIIGSTYNRLKFTICFNVCFFNDISLWYCNKGAFTNYVDKILPIIDRLPPYVVICEGIPLLHTRWYFLYVPPNLST